MLNQHQEKGIQAFLPMQLTRRQIKNLKGGNGNSHADQQASIIVEDIIQP